MTLVGQQFQQKIGDDRFLVPVDVIVLQRCLLWFCWDAKLLNCELNCLLIFEGMVDISVQEEKSSAVGTKV